MVGKKIIYAALLFLLLAGIYGCTGDSSTSGQSGPGILQGKVSIGPLCPAEVPGDQCKPKPDLYTSHMIVVLNESGNIVATTGIHADGTYQIELEAGSYL